MEANPVRRGSDDQCRQDQQLLEALAGEHLLNMLAGKAPPAGLPPEGQLPACDQPAFAMRPAVPLANDAADSEGIAPAPAGEAACSAEFDGEAEESEADPSADCEDELAAGGDLNVPADVPAAGIEPDAAAADSLRHQILATLSSLPKEPAPRQRVLTPGLLRRLAGAAAEPLLAALGAAAGVLLYWLIFLR